jgi:hypothetical protein
MRRLQDVLGRYAGPLQFVKAHGPRGRQVGNAHVLAAVAAAYMRDVPRNVLERFCEVLDSGIPADESEVIVVKVRDRLKTLRGSMKHRAEARRTAMKGIALFAAGENPARLIVPDHDIYKLGNIEGEQE